MQMQFGYLEAIVTLGKVIKLSVAQFPNLKKK